MGELKGGFNMREIKFRAWYKTAGRMFDVAKIGCYGYVTDLLDKGYRFHAALGDIVLMQYTGLKDKNGVEIYEGDVVNWDDANWEVIWFAHGYALADDYGRCMMSDHFNVLINGNELLDVEVIGNIHENPELLENNQ